MQIVKAFRTEDRYI